MSLPRSPERPDPAGPGGDPAPGASPGGAQAAPAHGAAAAGRADPARAQVPSGGAGSRGPGRTRRPSAAERRTQILREGVRCFAARGFHGTTTREVAERVGITEAALYRYFPSKEALYAAVVGTFIRPPALLPVLEAAAQRRDDEAVFRALARGVLESGTRDPELVRILAFTGLEAHELAAPLFDARIGPLRHFVHDYVRTRIEDGAFRAVDPMLGARAFLGMLWDYLNVRVVHGEKDVYPQPLEEVVDAFVTVFLAGIRAPAREDAP